MLLGTALFFGGQALQLDQSSRGANQLLPDICRILERYADCLGLVSFFNDCDEGPTEILEACLNDVDLSMVIWNDGDGSGREVREGEVKGDASKLGVVTILIVSQLDLNGGSSVYRHGLVEEMGEGHAMADAGIAVLGSAGGRMSC